MLEPSYKRKQYVLRIAYVLMGILGVAYLIYNTDKAGIYQGRSGLGIYFFMTLFFISFVEIYLKEKKTYGKTSPKLLQRQTVARKTYREEIENNLLEKDYIRVNIDFAKEELTINNEYNVQCYQKTIIDKYATGLRKDFERTVVLMNADNISPHEIKSILAQMESDVKNTYISEKTETYETLREKLLKANIVNGITTRESQLYEMFYYGQTVFCLFYKTLLYDMEETLKTPWLLSVRGKYGSEIVVPFCFDEARREVYTPVEKDVLWAKEYLLLQKDFLKTLEYDVWQNT